MNKKAFTLVELIVVITILAVLATVAFISFQGYGQSARDSTRLSDMKSMEKLLDLSKLTNNRYPTPENSTSVTYSGSVAWTQGVFGQTAYTGNASMSNVPVDPVTALEYPYSITANGQEYQLAAVLENPEASTITQSTYAGDQEAQIYVKGNYNGQFLKVKRNNTTYLLGVPSILTSDIVSSQLLEDILTNNRLVYNGHKNLPSSFSGSVYKTDGGFDFGGAPYVASDMILFVGDTSDLETDPAQRVALLDKLQASYSGSVIQTESGISELLSVDSSSSSASSNYVAIALNNSLKTSIPVVEVTGNTDSDNFVGAIPTVDSMYLEDSIEYNGSIYFKGLTGLNGYELMNTNDFTSFNLIKDINSGSSNGLNPNYHSFAKTGGKLFFTGIDAVNGSELWVTDGTEVGTHIVKDINISGSGNPIDITEFLGKIYFKANDGINGSELWVSDGTEGGTFMLKDSRPGTSGNGPFGFTEADGNLFYQYDDGINGTELWLTDGTDSGTMLVKNIRSSSLSSNPSGFTEFGGKIYFSANDGINGTELWVSDGTDAGTVLVKDIRSTSLSSSPSGFTELGGKIYFKANDGINGTELWVSDGTDSGTVLVKDIRLTSLSSSPSGITEFGGKIYFKANDGINGGELWVSDGTDSGTNLFMDIDIGTGWSSPSDLSVMNGKLYFVANEGVSGKEVWVSDGTTLGTVNLNVSVPNY